MTVEEIFLIAVGKAPEERSAYLDAACAGNAELRVQVEALVRSHEHAGSLLEHPLFRTASTIDHPPPSAVLGGAIGPYKLIEVIGEGGMGTVYLAQQTEPVKRLVALKVIKAGMDSRQVLARFEAERQALALMDHPNIAKVLDAGTTGESSRHTPCAEGDGTRSVPATLGRPYFVMELVKGVPITKFCDDRKLSTRERLELFVPVCQAIQHAHQKGIIHRDVKPSNVLVALHDEHPVPKVIDFGVAKAVGQQLTEKTLYTNFGTLVGTPAYMAPEQATFNQLDIDTRADIYSLGVLLYELLAGSPPFEPERLKKAALDEVLRLVREEEPPRPSARLSTSETKASIAAVRQSEPAKLTKLLRGELDWLVMKALEKDRNRRYETANGFAADVQRYLAGVAVEAVPPSAWYRFRKFARRNKGPVISVATVVFALLGGIVGTTWGLIRATNAEADALAEGGEKEKALVQKDQALTQVQEEQSRTKAALLESQREAARLAFEQAYGECRHGDVDRGFVAMACCLPRARQAQMPDLEESIRVHLAGWARSVHPWRTVFPYDGGFRAISSQEMAAAFSPNGKTIIIAGQTSVRSWEVETGRLLGNFNHNARNVAISADGKMVATVSTLSLTEARLWEATTGKSVGLPLRHQAVVLAVAFSPDGKTILTSSADQTARLWDVQTGKMAGPVFKHPSRMSIAAFSPDGKTVVTAGDNAQLWDARTGNAIGSLLEQRGGIGCVGFSPDGKMMATAGSGAYAQVWECATGKPLGRPLPNNFQVLAIAISPDGKSLLTGGANTVHVWEVESGRELVPPLQHRDKVSAVAFSPDGNTALSADRSGAYLWQLDTARKTFVGLRHESVNCGVFSPDGRSILTGGADKAARLWDAVTGSPRGAPMPHSSSVLAVAFSPDGKTVLTGSHEARIWDVETGMPLGQPMPEPQGAIAAVAFRDDGKTIITGTPRGTVQRWAHSGEPLSTPRLDHLACRTLAISPDGKTIATGGTDKTVRLWDAKTGRALGPPLPHEAEVGRVSFSPDGRILVTTTAFRNVRLWDVTTGNLLGQPIRDVGLLVVTPGGKCLFGLRQWETGTGKMVGKDLEASKFVAMSGDGKTLLTGNTNGIMHLWHIAPVEGEPARIILWAQVVTGMEVDEKGNARVLDFETRRERRRQLDKLGGPPWPPTN